MTYPKLIRFVPAPYPEAARKEGRQGVVVLHVTVGSTGKVTLVKVARSAGKDLDEAAIKAVKQFVYKPATVDGKPVIAKIKVAYPFQLRQPVQATPRRQSPAAARRPTSTTGPVSPPTRRVASPPRRAAGARPIVRRRAPTRATRPATKAGRARLSGKVREKGTRKYLEDAEVLVFRKKPGQTGKGRLLARTFADTRGKFSLPPFPPGEYHVEVRSPGCYLFKVTEKLAPGERLKVEYFVERRSYDPYQTVVTSKVERKEVTRYSVALPEIQKIPGTQGDALRAIQNMPGVARAPFSMGLLVIRGSAPQDTRVFFEGHEIPQLYHFLGLTSVFNSDLLKRIDFIPGNFSVKYGRATGGIIDVLTRPGKRDRWHGYLDIDLWDVGALAEGPVGKGSLALSLRRSHIDAVLALIPDMAFAPAYYDYQAMFDYPVLRGNLKVLVFGSDDRMKMKNDGKWNTVYSTLFHKAIVAWGRRWGDHELKASLSGGYSLMDMEIGASDRLEKELGRFGWRLRYAHSICKNLKVAVGLAGEVAHASFNFSLLSLFNRGGNAEDDESPNDGEGGPFDDMDVPEIPIKDVVISQAFYLEATWKIADRLTLIPGIRVDYLKVGPLSAFVFDPRFTARVALVRKKLFLTGAVGLFHQEPQLQQLYEKTGGNPDVRHEQSLHTSLGISWQILPSLSLEVTGFYKHLWDLVAASDEVVWRNGEQVRENVANHGLGRIYGGELLIKKMSDRACPRFLHMEKCFGWISYTLLRSERKDGPGQPWHLYDFDQTHILTVVLAGAWRGGWELGIRFRLTSGNPTTYYSRGLLDADKGTYIGVPGGINSGRLPLFHQLDLRLDKKFVFKRWFLSIYLDIQNMYYNQTSEFVQYNFNFTKRTFAKGLPIIPSLGIKGSF